MSSAGTAAPEAVAHGAAAWPGLQRPDLMREAAYVGGEWIESRDTMDVQDPASGRTIGTVPDLGARAAEDAVAAASAALPAWRAAGASARADVLLEWYRLTMLHQGDLARLMTLEQGKPLAEAEAEVAYAASFLRWFAEEARRIYGTIIPGHKPDARLSVTREPVGVVAAITPWNFPLAMIARKVGPALAAGCTIVVKPSELTPFSALALTVLAQEAGIPPGVLNVVTGQAAPIGEVLTQHPAIAKLSFTGSTPVGKMLAAQAMSTVKRVSLELGGNAPFLVFPDADLDAAVQGALASKFRNAGQTCVCANRFIVHEDIAATFAQRLASAAGDLKVGSGFEEGTKIGPLIDERAQAKVARHVADALAQGGKLLTGGGARQGSGYFCEPTVIDGAAPDSLFCREETFGPLAGLLHFRKKEEAIRLANSTRSGLAAYVYTGGLDTSHRVCEALEYGMIGLNTGIISTEVAPFGGIKESGFGREGSRYGIDDYVNMKLVCTSVSSAAA